MVNSEFGEDWSKALPIGLFLYSETKLKVVFLPEKLMEFQS